jgi:peptide/nickel transport system permease protein
LGNSRGAGIVFVSALLVITVNFLVDLIYGRLDPRIAAGR